MCVISCQLQPMNIVHYSQLPLYDGNYLLATHHYSLPSCLRKRSLFSVFRPNCPPCAPSYHSTGSWNFLSTLTYLPFILFQFLLSKLFCYKHLPLSLPHCLSLFFFFLSSLAKKLVSGDILYMHSLSKLTFTPEFIALFFLFTNIHLAGYSSISPEILLTKLSKCCFQFLLFGHYFFQLITLITKTLFSLAFLKNTFYFTFAGKLKGQYRGFSYASHSVFN